MSSKQSVPPESPNVVDSSSVQSEPVTGAVSTVPHKPPVRKRRWLLWGSLGVVVLAIGSSFALHEMQTSALQAKYFSGLASGMAYQVKPGKAAEGQIFFPEYGPFDVRMGYAQLPSYIQALEQNGFVVTNQARWSQGLIKSHRWQFYPPYHEKAQAGLLMKDQYGETIYDLSYPGFVFEKFTDISPLIVNSLLFIENRHLLDQDNPQRNPAVEWARMTRVTADLVLNRVGVQDDNVAGGSTLATQIEKYRHSPDGLTRTPLDKLRQMGSASLRAYLDGANTFKARQQIALDYINTVPLAARSGFGEVNGVGDGLRIWYGRDPWEVNQLLNQQGPLARGQLSAKALAYKQVLSLFLAQRRPSYYLGGKSPDNLDTLTNEFLDLMADGRVIDRELAKAAQALKLTYGKQSRSESAPFVGQKAVNFARSRLVTILGMPSLYDLDRLDLTVQTTFDQKLQKMASHTLRRMQTQEGAAELGLFGEYLFSPGNDLSKVIFSFTLMERTPTANVVRIQADNYDQPFDVNEGVKLDLGSTAKLRTLISYLNAIAWVHQQYGTWDAAKLQKVDVAANNALLRWSVSYLSANPGAKLEDMLAAAMQRSYSANPGERFFTGGGVHSFKNFNSKYDAQVVTAQTALRHSINLPFIRMMREIVYFHMQQIGGGMASLDDERREAYLEKFADREGAVFTRGFYRKYKGKKPAEIQAALFDDMRLTPTRLAVAYNKVALNPNLAEFQNHLKTLLPGQELTNADIAALFERYGPNKYSLVDQGYIARIHPLELSTVAYLMRHPDASFKQLLDASAKERQLVYGWLRKTRYKNAQDIRIRQLMEVEAFLEIHKEWKRLGYPFESLVPSYATSIGSSADRPAALAELMGIIVNEGKRLPTVRMQQLHFAAGTPYETVMERNLAAPEQVLSPQVAAQVKKALQDVVDEGTAQRLKQPFVDGDGNVMYVGGKTGTGDHRYEVFGAGGQLIRSTVMNRTATFVFYIGDRYFGTITAFVPGKEAGQYRFTSGLPVQLLKAFVPGINEYLKNIKHIKPAATPEAALPALAVSAVPVLSESSVQAASAVSGQFKINTELSASSAVPAISAVKAITQPKPVSAVPPVNPPHVPAPISSVIKVDEPQAREVGLDALINTLQESNTESVKKEEKDIDE